MHARTLGIGGFLPLSPRSSLQRSCMSTARAVAAATVHASTRATRAQRRALASTAPFRRRPSCWIGLDGTPKGWSAALLDENGDMTMLFLPKLDSIWRIQRHYDLRAIAIDMPLALPEHAEAGGRGCERMARKILSQAKKRAEGLLRAGVAEDEESKRTRRYSPPSMDQMTKIAPRASPPTFVGHSSIFGPPTRAAMVAFVAGATHEECSEANREAARADVKEIQARKGKSVSELPFGLSVQLYYIMPKIAELEEFMRSHVGRDTFVYAPPSADAAAEEHDKIGFFECHPEVSFLAMLARHDAAALHQHTTALYSKRTKQGVLQRLLLIATDESCTSLRQQNGGGGGTAEDVLQCLVKHVQPKSPLRGSALAVKNARKGESAADFLTQLTSWQSYVVDDTDGHEDGAALFSADRVQLVPTNDGVDAIACALAAHRFDNGRCIAVREGDEDVLDHRGMPMTMFA